MNTNWPREHGDEHFKSHTSNERGLCLIVETEDQTIGYLVGHLNEQTELRPLTVAEIESMYVEPEYRSGGIGAGLANQFLKWAERNSATRVAVSAFVANERAIAFYERLGFKPRMLTLARVIE